MTIVVAVFAAWLAWSPLSFDPLSAVVVAGLVTLAWSFFAAVFWPFTACPVIGCDKGKLRRPGKRKTYRKCGWCGGSGARVRWARRLYDEARPAKHGRR